MNKPKCCGQCRFLRIQEETVGYDETLIRHFMCGIDEDDVEAFLTDAKVPYDCPIKWEDDENEPD